MPQDLYRDEFETYEKRIRSYVETQLGTLQENLVSHQDHLAKTRIKFEEIVSENQKETLWKIKDCESLLSTRISEQKVIGMNILFQKKLTSLIEDNDTKLSE